jgi:hypothetical protein
LIANRVRVYVIGIGPSIKSDVLQMITDETGGEFRSVTLPIDPEEDNPAVQIRDALIEFQGIAHRNSEMVMKIQGSIDSEGEPVEKGQEQIEDGLQVLIEEESELATFTLSWKSVNDRLLLKLESPSGNIYEASSYPDDARLIDNERPFMGFQVKNPELGLWIMKVIPEYVEGHADYKLFVFSENPKFHGSLVTPGKVCNIGDPVKVRFLGHYDFPTKGLDLTESTVTFPNGKTVSLVFDEAGEDGIYEANFPFTGIPGMYTFNIVVNGEEGEMSYARHCWPNKDWGEEPPAPPPFRREYTRTVAVSETPYQHVTIEPESGQQGEEQAVILKGNLTHFTKGTTTLDFGRGITVKNVDVLDIETAQAMLHIDRDAPSGSRKVIINTDDHDEAIEIEKGFQVEEHKPVWDCRNLRLQLLLLSLWGLGALVVSVLFRGSEWVFIVQLLITIGLLVHAAILFWLCGRRNMQKIGPQTTYLTKTVN